MPTNIDELMPTVVAPSTINSYRKIPYHEMLEISSSLEDYHKVFYTFFEMAAMYYVNDEELPTAAVRFHRYGKPDLLLGENFWKSLSLEEKTFVICHECLHILLDHGVRNGMTIKGATPYLVNVAQDITINEMIVDLFGFERNDLKDWKNYCWIDTCFEDPTVILRNESFTYYLKKIIENPSNSVKNETMKTLDSHGQPSSTKKTDGLATPGSGETDDEKSAKERFAKDLAEELSSGDLKKVKDALAKDANGASQGAGTIEGTYDFIIRRKDTRARLKINKLINKMKRSMLKKTEVEIESFVARDRRFQSVLSHNVDIHLPGNAIYDKPKKDKLLVALYTDISGSCIEFIPLFKKILLAFMGETNSITTIAHTFNTSVQRVTYDTVIRGGGGTAFDIIETNNLKLESEIGRYPDAVIIITDGEGNQVIPKMPKRWIWLLTPKWNNKTYIQSTSKWYLTKDVIFE